ncbi:hypothetical protein SAMN04490202_0660 [Pseudomonas reinekei]|uniref:Uncharacterized protein n=1 Tax=Pseudomonas reinekei TaxID=395598 RepID=A0A1H0IWY9_PSERE|nr:hypothetical protein [Pseudomonas reinekei]KAB0480892.1 hypothetical protein F7R15_27055 [Pseudomonas reinekei]OLT99421.1 hypothetical protein BVK86_26320 [Pseudomonas reinekei]SDO35591.1 hypothetical protein SAMN04490202_0660 [Pseudomonas reinekei]
MKTKSSRLPVDIDLPERALLEEGAFFVRLRTLDELDEFWIKHRHRFFYACEGKSFSNPSFLHEYEWVFGSTKATVVRTVLRWGQSEIDCEFYDWAKHDPQMHQMFFLGRDADRDSMIENGIWLEKNENDFRVDCVRRSVETYRGWWRFCNLPKGYNPNEWLTGGQDYEELIDPHMAYQEVATALQEQTFDDWRQSDFWELESHNSESIDQLILYWKNERANGEGYYGEENEPPEITS